MFVQSLVKVRNEVQVVGSFTTEHIVGLALKLATYAIAFIVYNAPAGCAEANVKVTTPTVFLAAVIVTPLVLDTETVPLFAIKAQAKATTDGKSLTLIFETCRSPYGTAKDPVNTVAIGAVPVPAYICKFATYMVPKLFAVLDVS